jgi:hypothetical protein
MRRDQASKDRLKVLVGFEVEAQAEVSGTNGQNGDSLASVESSGDAAEAHD